MNTSDHKGYAFGTRKGNRWANARRAKYIAEQRTALSTEVVPAHLRGNEDEARKVSAELFDRSTLPMKPPGKQ
jgi:hypothetical protein